MVWLFDGKVVNLTNDNYVESSVIESMFVDDYTVDNYEVSTKNDSNNYNEKSNNEVLLELYIPRISLRKYVYTLDSSKNNVNVNVALLKGSDIGLNLYFLAAHSGGRRVSFFDDLVYLEKGDIIWIYIGGKSLGYVVDDIFYIEKRGYFEANYSSDGNRLFLITCSLEDKSKQIVVTGKLVYSS